MVGYVEARGVRPLIENQYLLILCAATILVMMGHGIISPVLPLYAQSLGVGTAMIGLTITVFGAARLVVNLPAGFLPVCLLTLAPAGPMEEPLLRVESATWRVSKGCLFLGCAF